MVWGNENRNEKPLTPKQIRELLAEPRRKQTPKNKKKLSVWHNTTYQPVLSPSARRKYNNKPFKGLNVLLKYPKKKLEFFAGLLSTSYKRPSPKSNSPYRSNNSRSPINNYEKFRRVFGSLTPKNVQKKPRFSLFSKSQTNKK